MINRSPSVTTGGHCRSAQAAKGKHKSPLSLQVNWQGVTAQVAHCRHSRSVQRRRSSEVSTPPQVTERWVWPQGTASEVGLSPFLPMVQWSLRWEERARPHSGSLGPFLYIRLCYGIQCVLSSLGLSPGHSADQMLRALWPLLSQAGQLR